MDRPAQGRQRTRSNFSVRSDKSGSSKTSKTKLDLKETPEEKHKRGFSTSGKANPLAAMREAQPVAAALEAPTIIPLRSVRPVDSNGNAIAEPDLANPMRSRWERPLDTIRSFEAAIDTAHRRRTGQRPVPAPQSDSGSGYGYSRRSSYFGDQYQNSQSSQGHYNSGHYNHNGGSGYGYGRGGPRGPPQRVPMNRRQNSEPFPHRAQSNENMYPNPGYGKSRDTVISSYTNGSSEQWNGSTNPSSENSSLDRIATNPGQRAGYEGGDSYGHSGYHHGGGAQKPIMEEGPPPQHYPVQPVNQSVSAEDTTALPPPPVPAHEYSANGVNAVRSVPPQAVTAAGALPPQARNMLTKLNSSSRQNGPVQAVAMAPAVPAKDGGIVVTARPAMGGKRMSWLKRTFSKSGRA